MPFSPFGRPYSGNPGWFLFLPLLRCFSSGGSRPRSGRRGGRGRRSHSAIPGSKAACASPGLIAACHDLRRRPSRAIRQAGSLGKWVCGISPPADPPLGLSLAGGLHLAPKGSVSTPPARTTRSSTGALGPPTRPPPRGADTACPEGHAAKGHAAGLWRPIFAVGLALRCFQRVSLGARLPGLAFPPTG